MTTDERPAAVLFNDSINLGHQADRFAECNKDLLIVVDIFIRERAAATILEPLVADLVTADMKVSDFRRNPFKVSRSVYIDVSVVVLGIVFGDFRVALSSETGDESFERAFAPRLRCIP